MSRAIEHYTDLKLKARMDNVHDLIQELESVQAQDISAETEQERSQALRDARHLYTRLAAEYVKRKRAEVGALTEGSTEEQ